MAQIESQDQGGKKGGKKRAKKHSTGIDMTPMVDLMCLLITFFMLTTAFAKPKVMVITMPEKDKNQDQKEQPKISKERTLNILLSGNDEVYYYKGLVAPGSPMPQLIKSDFSKDGIRKMLLDRNRDLFTKITEYRDKRLTGEIIVADTTYDETVKQMKLDDKKGPIVLIKADTSAMYRDIVNIIDEMAICDIASYAVVDIGQVEDMMIQAYRAGTQLTEYPKIQVKEK
ncbi:MAG: biopolymer transporter ExbD [Bacteroidetes bacterium]|nr:MAG: biopolymer transporter ExbD [Bacteroidota bacterium]